MMRAMILAVYLLPIGLAGAAEQSKTFDGRWNVLDFGAKADGKTDNTAAFQKALDAASTSGGTVWAPPGQYRFAGSLEVPENVTLAGSWEGLKYFPAQYVEEGHRGKVGNGTQFLVYGGRGQPEKGKPFLSLKNDSTLKGAVISYPEQSFDTGDPIPYPWTIFGKGDGICVIDVCLLRAYQGVKLMVAPCHLIRNLTGTPILTGLYLDGIHDIGRVENVHFKSGAGASPAARLWAARNSTGFVIGTTDWQYMTNTFCWGYGTGYHFIQGEGIGPNGNFLGIGADRAHVAVRIDAAKFQGIAITNGEFVVGPMGAVPGRAARKMDVDPMKLVDKENSNPAHVVVSTTNTGSVRFSNCAFWGGSNNVARVAGRGAINFGDCAFRQWGGPEASLPAFIVEGGNLQVHDCQFNWNAPQAQVGPNANGALFANNTYTGEWRLTAPKGAYVQATGNLRADSPYPGPQKIGKAGKKQE